MYKWGHVGKGGGCVCQWMLVYVTYNEACVCCWAVEALGCVSRRSHTKWKSPTPLRCVSPVWMFALYSGERWRWRGCDIRKLFSSSSVFCKMDEAPLCYNLVERVRKPITVQYTAYTTQPTCTLILLLYLNWSYFYITLHSSMVGASHQEGFMLFPFLFRFSGFLPQCNRLIGAFELPIDVNMSVWGCFSES